MLLRNFRSIFRCLRYEKVEARVIRQVERLDVAPEDPETYYARYGSTLLDTNELLAQVKQLGIVEDLVSNRLNPLVILI